MGPDQDGFRKLSWPASPMAVSAGVFLSGNALQVAELYIERVAVLEADHAAGRDLPVLLLPYIPVIEFPLGKSGPDKLVRPAVAVFANGYGSIVQRVLGQLSLFELVFAHAFQHLGCGIFRETLTLVPGNMPGLHFGFFDKFSFHLFRYHQALPFHKPAYKHI